MRKKNVTRKIDEDQRVDKQSSSHARVLIAAGGLGEIGVLAGFGGGGGGLCFGLRRTGRSVERGTGMEIRWDEWVGADGGVGAGRVDGRRRGRQGWAWVTGKRGDGRGERHGAHRRVAVRGRWYRRAGLGDHGRGIGKGKALWQQQWRIFKRACG
ncbi:hypothetical protein K438DRAFT_1783097 [Mycena galopus ATCC 62051]|nr:hypothetical protein K438DRAFT_1783097 [Mycena galopus ATCC 62051]